MYHGILTEMFERKNNFERKYVFEMNISLSSLATGMLMKGKKNSEKDFWKPLYIFGTYVPAGEIDDKKEKA